MIDPRILILDDALSAVDTYTEEEILTRLRGVMRQRTSIIVVAPRLHRPRRRPDPRARRGPDRRARHATTSWSRAGGVYAELYRKQLLRRRSSRVLSLIDPIDHDVHDEEVLGKAYDARLMRRLLGYLRPYTAQVALALAAIVGASLLQLAQPYLMKLAIDRLHRAPATSPGWTGSRSLFLGDPGRRVRARVPADLDAADDRAADHVRPADADLRAPAAARPAVLRPQPGRPADDARHDRRRRAQRPVHRRASSRSSATSSRWSASWSCWC